jgi:hypothetical protein
MDGKFQRGTLLTGEGVLDPNRSRALTVEIANAIGLKDAEKFGLNETVQLLLDIPETTLAKLRDVSNLSAL